MMVERMAIRCRISGRVQGVWFRASTREQALALGLDGYANNLPDGRVEVVACGDAASLERLRSWLQRGPAHASVERVECETVGDPGCRGFTTG